MNKFSRKKNMAKYVHNQCDRNNKRRKKIDRQQAIEIHKTWSMKNGESENYKITNLLNSRFFVCFFHKFVHFLWFLFSAGFSLSLFRFWLNFLLCFAWFLLNLSEAVIGIKCGGWFDCRNHRNIEKKQLRKKSPQRSTVYWTRAFVSENRYWTNWSVCLFSFPLILE